jgi:hypothetical protein
VFLEPEETGVPRFQSLVNLAKNNTDSLSNSTSHGLSQARRISRHGNQLASFNVRPAAWLDD